MVVRYHGSFVPSQCCVRVIQAPRRAAVAVCHPYIKGVLCQIPQQLSNLRVKCEANQKWAPLERADMMPPCEYEYEYYAGNTAVR